MRVLIYPSEPPRERVKVSHVIVECRVINHHPTLREPVGANIHFTGASLIIDDQLLPVSSLSPNQILQYIRLSPLINQLVT